MIEIYISFLLIMLSTLVLIALVIAITIKSYHLSKYIRRKSETYYEKIHGIVRDPVSGFKLYDNLTYWTWIFKDIKKEDKITSKYKKSLRRCVYGILICIIVIVIVSIYLYTNYR